MTLLSDDNLLNVSVYNLLGQQIETQDLNKTRQYQLHTNELASGVYVVKIKTEKGMVAKRLVVN